MTLTKVEKRIVNHLINGAELYHINFYPPWVEKDGVLLFKTTSKTVHNLCNKGIIKPYRDKFIYNPL